MRICSIENCRNKHYGHDLCSLHYQQQNHIKEYQQQIKSSDEHKNKKKNFYEKTKELVKQKVKNYGRTLKGRYKKAAYNAPRAGHDWNLTFEEYVFALGNSKCYYCDGAISETGSGLDRKNNEEGYKINNVVPCCYTCNTFKRNLLSFEEMIEVVRLLKQLRNKEDIWT